jgi:hypothetical protein
MTAFMSMRSDVSGTSMQDIKAQEILNVGVAPIRQETEKRPVEEEMDEYADDPFGMSDVSKAVLRDANAPATKLTNLEGLPE